MLISNYKTRLLLIPFVIVLCLNSCMPPGFEITRVEEDNFRIVNEDTTKVFFENNSLQNKDNGVVFPSSKTIKVEREYTTYDSSVTREYPDFIRAGVFEAGGLITGMSNPLPLGIFGVHPATPIGESSYRGESGSRVFTGGLYRFLFYESRLRWFKDSKNWTWGTTAFEAIVPNGELENTLTAIFPIYLRKRYYLSENIPYICYTPTLGIAYNPLLSLYINPSITLDIGSLGGLNLRAYLGFAAGFNSALTPMIKNNDFVRDEKVKVVTIPYAGLGFSILDFHNLVPETYKEWKEMQHSAWDIGVLQAYIVSSNASTSIFGETKTPIPIKGFQMKLFNTNLAIPILNNNSFYVGTTFLNLMYLGDNSTGIGILPVRFGYWHTLLEDELSLEPFFEFNYYPSQILNIGTKLNLRISEKTSISVLLAYASGSVINDMTFKQLTKFNNFYVGIGFNLWDRIFYQNELRYSEN